MAAALALPAVGAAARPRAVQQGYRPVAGVGAELHRDVRVAPVAAQGATLPFTGLDLALIAAGGGGLLLLGGGLKRAARHVE